MKKDRDGKSVDNTITYYNSNDLKVIKETLRLLDETQMDHFSKHDNIFFDIDVFDYENCKYINKQLGR